MNEAEDKMRVSLAQLYETILSRQGADPEKSYVASLISKGEDAILQKVGEEAFELVLAAKNHQGSTDPASKETTKIAVVKELADLWFHQLVWMAQADITPEDVELELGRRFGQSGLEEKRNRENNH